MKKVIFIILISVISVWSNKKFCNSDTFQNIQAKSILEMSDGEYRIFDEYHDKCFKCKNCDRCKDKYVLEIQDKSISQMTTNEYDYFSDHFWNCDSLKPCSLKQYIEIKDKNEIEMTNNEYDFYHKCKEECESYQNHNSHKSRLLIFAISGFTICLLGGGLLFYFPRSY